MQLETATILYAFGLTLFAGLATGIGSCIAFFAKRTNMNFLCLSLGFSAGVMLYVSFVEILATAREALTNAWGAIPGAWGTALAFFSGIACVAFIDWLIPDSGNPHEIRLVEEMQRCLNDPKRMASGACIDEKGAATLRRTGVFTALAIAVHNFPEGLATFSMALANPAVGASIALAIAIHNIPEGIAVSVPLYYATGNRKKAFFWSFASGLSEPIGAGIGFLLILPFFSPAVSGVLFASVAGIMVYVSLDELLPAAEQYGAHHICIYGLVAGMAVMAVSLLLFA